MRHGHLATGSLSLARPHAKTSSVCLDNDAKPAHHRPQAALKKLKQTVALYLSCYFQAQGLRAGLAAQGERLHIKNLRYFAGGQSRGWVIQKMMRGT